MKIRRIRIDQFAGLSDVEIVPSKDFLLIWGNNESGKSTIVAFIRAMFYGLGRRNKNPEKNARLRYTPWNPKGAMGGSLEFECHNETFLLERRFGSRKTEDKVSLWNQTRYQEVMLKNPDAPGEEIFELSENEFIISSLIDSPRTDLDNQSLAEKINHLRDSGHEHFSTDEINNALEREALSYRKGQNSGTLVELEQQLSELEEQFLKTLERDRVKEESLSRLGILKSRLNELETFQAYQSLQREIEEIETELKDYAKQKKKREEFIKESLVSSDFSQQGMQMVPVIELNRMSQMGVQLEESKRSFEKMRQELEEALTRERKWDAILSQEHQKEKESARSFNYFRKIQKKHALAWKKKRSKSNWFLPSAAIPAVLGLALTVILLSQQDERYKFALALTILLPLFMFVIYLNGKKKYETRYKQHIKKGRSLSEQCEHYRLIHKKAQWEVQQAQNNLDLAINNTKKIRLQFEEVEQDYYIRNQELRLVLKPWLDSLDEEADSLETLYRLREYSLEHEKRQAWFYNQLSEWEKKNFLESEERYRKNLQIKDELEIESEQLSDSISKDLKQRFADEDISNELINLREKITIEKIELHHLNKINEDTASIERALRKLKDQYNEKLIEAQAINLAKDILEVASAKYERVAKPELHDRANRWLTLLTDGRYEKMLISSGWELKIARDNREQFHHDSFYSSGTRDLIFLSLRLAIADMLAKHEYNVLPLFLDDSFAFLDDERTETALKSLLHYSEESGRQIVLLTSSNKARNFIEAHNQPVFVLT